MHAIMFLSGLIAGLCFGAILWEVLYAGPAYRKAREHEWRLAESVKAWQRMYLYAEGSKAATSKAMDTFSKKVPDLKVVHRPPPPPPVDIEPQVEFTA